MIEIQNLTKEFAGRTVLNSITTRFLPGKTNLIIGQSGSGKTVLMRCIVGLIVPETGRIIYGERDFLAMNKRERTLLRREMGMVFQSAALFDSISVLENVRFPLDMFSNESYKVRSNRAQVCLDRVGLSEAASKKPAELSGGMQKRVAIARAIAMNPKYLFCDEPNSGLDPKTALVIDDLIHSITQEFQITTLITTHDMNSVQTIGEHIVFIDSGILEWQGTNASLKTEPNERLRRFIYATDYFEKEKNLAFSEKRGGNL